MNEIAGAMKVAYTAFRTVRIIDIIKKIVIAAAVAICGILALKFGRNK